MTLTRMIQHQIESIEFFFTQPTFPSPINIDLFKEFLEKFNINTTQSHIAFRQPHPDEKTIKLLSQMKEMSEKIRNHHLGFTVKNIVHIGIGGSALGPKFICEVFQEKINGLDVYFVDNLDENEIKHLLKKLSPLHTLFIVVSKSFRTAESLQNLRIAQSWLINHHIDIENHFIAITHHFEIAKKHHISDRLMLLIPESVVGRYSIWTTVGLTCSIAFGFEQWMMFHQGAFELDTHFFNTPMDSNLPIIYASQLYFALRHNQQKTLAIFPYSYRLRLFIDYLQQLFMESLGKNIDLQNKRVTYSTGPIVFGGVGTTFQHSLQQLITQGTHQIFADFILPLEQENMIANCLAQIVNIDKQIIGEKYINLFVLKKFNLNSMGALVAFYEYVVISLAFMLNLNPFNQPGVECAKTESEKILHQYEKKLFDLDMINNILNT